MALLETVKVGYWDCRGLVHPIILMLEYLEKPYEFQTPSPDLIGPAPTYDKELWYQAKATLLSGYNFPNLPYYHDPNLGLKITHSSAIVMHLARTHGLWPTQEEAIEADMLREELKDLISATTGLCYDGHLTSKQINQYIEDTKGRLELLNNMLQPHQSWFLSDLSYIDFLAYDILDHQRILFPDILDHKVDRLKVFMERFESLATISNFMKSPRYRKFPLWSERSFLGRDENQLPKL